ncbi:efflux RND transporter periplasmic adaptor subunit [Mucisphaera calidilacus]|uniref:HlyD family secretion protein n=1 Tax=Mucisphaera calidilacus TaxID=2527982 RepID=A0A518C139_9BACT|nr:efflux RND transporter periplasmic adaptor subunit [Mucisphaera calidilacus]QDU72946.1 HlyD family secretion protein [Mucisphaera calidilacus]
MQDLTAQARQAVQQALEQFERLSRATDRAPTEVAREVLHVVVETMRAESGLVWLAADTLGRAYRGIAMEGDLARGVLDEQHAPIGVVANALRKTWNDPAQAVVVPPGEMQDGPDGLTRGVQFYLAISSGRKRLGILQVICSGELDPKLYREYVAFCQQAAEAMGRHMGHRQSELVERSASHYRALLTLLQNLGRIEKPSDLAHELAQGARQLFHAQRAAVVGFWGSKPEAWFSDTLDPNPKANLAQAVRTLADATRASGQPMAFQKGQVLEGDAVELQPFVDQLFELGGAQAVCVTPITEDERTPAVLIVEHAEAVEASKLAPGEVELAESVGPFLARAIELEARPLRRLGQTLAQARTNPRRAAWRSGALMMALLALLLAMILPFPMAVRVDARLEPRVLHTLTTPYPGTVERVLVQAGQAVEQGEVILELDTTDVRAERALTRSAIREQELARRDARTQQRPGEMMLADLRIEQLRIQEASLSRRIERSAIRSPISGVVLSTRPEELEGTTVDQAKELLSIGDLSGFELVVEVPEQDVGLVQTRLTAGQPVRATFLSRPWPDLEQRVTYESLLTLSPSSVPDPATGQMRYELRTGISLDGLEPHLALSEPTGRARLDLGYAPLGWRLFRHAWHYVRMTLF